MDFDLEEEALIAGGVKGRDRISEYLGKLDELLCQFLGEVVSGEDPLMKAGKLFHWLWEKKPDRYRANSNYRLTDVIKAQMSQEIQVVGNCLGLTLMFNCLLRKMGIHADALYLENAFGIGPHILTTLERGEGLIDIENILPGGFDYKKHLGDPSRRRLGDKELVAEVYHGVGNELFTRGELADAMKSYEMTIRLDAHHQRAHLNILILSDEMRMEKDVVEKAER